MPPSWSFLPDIVIFGEYFECFVSHMGPKRVIRGRTWRGWAFFCSVAGLGEADSKQSSPHFPIAATTFQGMFRLLYFRREHYQPFCRRFVCGMGHGGRLTASQQWRHSCFAFLGPDQFTAAFRRHDCFKESIVGRSSARMRRRKRPARCGSCWWPRAGS